MQVQQNIQANSRVSRNKDGFRVDTVAIVSEIDGDEDLRLYTAITGSGLPSYGDEHPSIDNIYLNEITADIIDQETVKVKLSYYNDSATAEGGETTSRASGSTNIEETKLDINGDDMTTRYVDGSVIYPKVSFTAEIERPRVTFDFEYTVSSFPKTTIDTYLGKINSVIWNDYAVETILCVAVDVNQEGSLYRVRISFAYNADTWAFLAKMPTAPPLTAHATDPDSDLNLTTGIRPFDVYDQVDFVPLGLSL
jgi:hypothetical protein